MVMACVPVMSSGFGGVVLGYLLWLALGFLLGVRYPFARRDVSVWLSSILGMFFFAVPMLGLFGFVFIFQFLAFPMHLGVEACLALGGYVDAAERKARLVLFVPPLVVTLMLGLTGKYWHYSQASRPWRELYLNYQSTWGFFLCAFVIGLVVLLRASLRGSNFAAPAQGS
jgi:hypothetical protein